jgi:hypothetical protein
MADAAPAIVVTPTDAVRFLKALDPDASSFTFQTFDDNKDRENPRLAKIFHGTLDQHAAKIKRLIDQGAGIHVTINETDGRGRKEANIVKVRALFVDLDGAPLEPVLQGELKPHIITESSPGRWHAYWRVEGATLDEFRSLQLALIKQFDSDPGVIGLEHVMRLPGFMHRKATPFLSRIVSIYDHPAYPASMFERAHVAPRAASDDLTADDPLLMEAALSVIPNPDLHHDLWNKIGMAIWSAFDGSDQGLTAFDTWSRKSAKYDKRNTIKRWKGISRCPPDRIGAASLIYLANQTNTNWRDAYEAAAIDQIMGTASHDSKEPAKHRWDKTKDGKLRATLPNTKKAIEALGIGCRYDLFKLQYSINGEVLDAYMAAAVDDPALLRLREMIYERFKFDPTTDTVHTAVQTLANHHRFHPVRDYLDSLVWDGQPRLDSWLTNYAGVEDTPFVRAVGSLTLIAAARRVRQPGVKFDEWLVLQGEQGNAKSQALQLLAVKPEWFSDQRVIGLSGRDAIEALSGRWIIEAAELHGMKNSDVEALKAFQSRDTDRGRLAYARTPIEAKRQCVIIGTTNSDTFLRDLTGNRRWWPVTTGTFDLDALKRDRDQLWAEAAAREASGDSIRLPEALWPAAAEQQRQRVIDNPFTTTLEERLREPGHPNFDKDTLMTGIITSESLWVLLEIRPGQRSQHHNENLGAAMKELGWKKTRRRVEGRVAHVYQRGDDDRRITAYPGIDGGPPFANYDNPIPGQ